MGKREKPVVYNESVFIEGEIWKPIPNFENRYKISNKGRVISILKNKTVLLKPSKKKGGYYEVHLNKEGKVVCFLLHRLVATAFIPNPNNYPCINHKDEVKSNNNADNLEWCTYSYNNNYGSFPKKLSDVMSVPVVQMDLEGNYICRFNSLNEAAAHVGCAPSAISNVCRGFGNTAKGVKWVYENIETAQKGENIRMKRKEESKKRRLQNIEKSKKRVLQYDISGTFIAEYESITAASAAIGASTGFISSVCSGYGHAKSCYGFIFKYKEDTNA